MIWYYFTAIKEYCVLQDTRYITAFPPWSNISKAYLDILFIESETNAEISILW